MNITKRKPFSPGEILQEEFLTPLGLTQLALAEKLGVARRRVNEILRAKRSISADTAIRLGKLFNMSPEFWLNLQMKWDLWHALQSFDDGFKILPINKKAIKQISEKK